MIAQTSRDPWRAVWRVATSDGLLIALLLGVATGLALTSWLPQKPVADPIAYAQWFSAAQAHFGNATLTMETLGLFTLTRSLGFRALLALLAGCLSLRLIESGDKLRRNREIAEPVGEWQALADVSRPTVTNDLRRWHYRLLSVPPLLQADRWPWADLAPLLANGGALLLLIGLLITHLWGWRVEGLIVQGSERVTLPDSEEWVALGKDARSVTHSPGIVTFVKERGPGVQVRATNDTGRLLPLYPPKAGPVTQLTVALTRDSYGAIQDAQFAIPEAQLVIRLVPQPDHAIEAYSPVLLQVYRSPPGQLITEIVVEGDTELAVDEVRLELTSVPYAQTSAIFNPGLWPTGIGLVLLGAGLLGSVVWPGRRFWLLEETGEIKGSGDLPPALARGREA